MTSWDDLTPNQKIIRSSHLTKLRTALTSELNRRNKSSQTTYTDTNLEGKPIKAIHIQEIRDKINGIKTVNYTDNPIVANRTVVKAEHFTQLETVINLLESAPKVGGSTTCNSGCTGLCVGCSGTCTGSCSGCSGCGGCDGGCYGGCTGDCSGGCSGNCYGCYTGCSSCTGCGSGCSGGCISGCSNFCQGSCQTVCTGFNYGN